MRILWLSQTSGLVPDDGDVSGGYGGGGWVSALQHRLAETLFGHKLARCFLTYTERSKNEKKRCIVLFVSTQRLSL